uniref:DUF1279 domain-containing protein n=2 Tax=Ostreococcus mediterraneus TaxID=1486918 RepID=A0A7S0KKC8_9CHLO|mmetsp:Transcript_5335/g.19484  ORF Transcript_5335/g.19484 Transcript_5335/m.19484 type:complete len:271 (+) Transcript_5335:3-815(+)
MMTMMTTTTMTTTTRCAWSGADAGAATPRLGARGRVRAPRGRPRVAVAVEAHGVYGNDRRLMTTSSSGGGVGWGRRRRARVDGWWWWTSSASASSASASSSSSALRAQKSDREREIDAVTKKWGLEAGLWNVFKSPASSANQADKAGVDETDASVTPSRMDMAKALLKRYGSAYLFTSISLSLISITVFYFLVAGGVDVAGLLEKVGINVNATSESFGTFALAYAAHKASSPIRFGPTVALTPLVAKWLGKEIVDDDDEGQGQGDGGASK